MSNKEIIQENNSKLLKNNRDLSSILETVNNLPDEVKIHLQEKIVTPTIEQQEIMVDEGYTGLSKVTVEPMENVAPLLSVQDDHINAQTELLAMIKMELIRKGYIKENGGV